MKLLAPAQSPQIQLIDINHILMERIELFEVRGLASKRPAQS